MKKTLLFIGLLLLQIAASAQVLFTAEASKYKVGVGERFSVTFSINANAGNIATPSFEGFKVVAGPMRQMSTNIINGRASIQNATVYDLLPIKTGTFTIGAAKTQVNGETFATKPLTIEVVAGQQNQEHSASDFAGKMAYVKILTTKKTAYVGEVIPVRHTLYLKTNVGQFTPIQEPDFQGFLKNDIEIKGLDVQREIINGEQWSLVDISKYVLLPQRAGTFKPGKLSLQLPTQIPTGRRDWFGNQEMTTIDQVSTSVFPTLEIKPLPSAGKPEGFSGAVGDYKFAVNLSRNQVKANESITLTVTLTGEGNLQVIEIPKPEIHSSIEAYDPKQTDNISVTLNGIKGSKKLEYLLVPRFKGSYRIAPLTFSFFNPKTEKYTTITTPEQIIEVTEGPAAAATPGAPSADKTEVTAVGQDILFIQTQAPAFTKPGKPFFGSTGFWAWLGVLFVFAFGGYFAWRYRETYRPNKNLIAKKQAGSEAKKRLKFAKEKLDSNDYLSFYAAVNKALQDYFQDKFGLEPAKFSATSAAETATRFGADVALSTHIEMLIQKADMARFAPTNANTAQTDFATATIIFHQLENLK